MALYALRERENGVEGEICIYFLRDDNTPTTGHLARLLLALLITFMIAPRENLCLQTLLHDE